MSSSPTTLTSTTGSSRSSSSRRDGGASAGAGGSGGSPPGGQSGGSSPRANTVVIACGALGAHIREIAERRCWDVSIHCLPAGLHNSPRSIGPAAERLALELQASGSRVALAYADCGTYGELDRLCERLGISRLPGLHCYDVLAGPERVRAMFEAEPGTYVLTDFLVRSFRRSVIESLGLDRHPELWDDYFGHYRRLVWLAQSPRPDVAAAAQAVAEMFGLPLTRVDVGVGRLEAALESLVKP